MEADIEADTNDGIASIFIFSVVADAEYEAETISRSPFIFEKATLEVDVGQPEGNSTLEEFVPSA